MIKKTNLKKYDCIIIGAGASGLFCASAMTKPGKKLIIEKTNHPGQKLLLSGNGMCNITHGGSIKDFPSHYSQYNVGDEGAKPIQPGGKIRSCLYKHNNQELMKLCEHENIPLVEREDGKVFPASMKADDILQMLLRKTYANGFELLCGQPVTAIDPVSTTVYVGGAAYGSTCNRGADVGTALAADKLIIATGGASYPATGSDGTFMKILERDLAIKTTDLKPALTSIYVENYPYRELAGISFENVEVTCNGHKERGPILFTHKGFSGPAILHLSQYAKPGQTLVINFLTGVSPPDALRKLKASQSSENRSVANYLAKEFKFPKAFAEKMSKEPTRRFSSLGPKELEALAHLITNCTHIISGTGGWNDAMVTAGGVSLENVDLKTMSLKNYPSIKIIGEALDINGDTGGYNLQFAYSSAMAAI